jgi:hypothetical protein
VLQNTAPLPNLDVIKVKLRWKKARTEVENKFYKISNETIMKIPESYQELKSM